MLSILAYEIACNVEWITPGHGFRKCHLRCRNNLLCWIKPSPRPDDMTASRAGRTWINLCCTKLPPASHHQVDVVLDSHLRPAVLGDPYMRGAWRINERWLHLASKSLKIRGITVSSVWISSKAERAKWMQLLMCARLAYLLYRTQGSKLVATLARHFAKCSTRRLNLIFCLRVRARRCRASASILICNEVTPQFSDVNTLSD